MATVKVYNTTGKSVGDQSLSSDVFEVAMNADLVHQTVVAQRANSRQVLAHTKTRSEVRGGGRKPWRQKGTGRARHGSIRSPLWRGGGVTFGPRNDRNFTKKLNKKMKNKALRMVLSDKVASEHLIVLDSFDMANAKTKDVAAMLQALPTAGKSVLLVMAEKNEAVYKSARNLVKVQSIAANSLNVVDIMKYDYVVMDTAAVEMVESVYGINKQEA